MRPTILNMQNYPENQHTILGDTSLDAFLRMECYLNTHASDWPDAAKRLILIKNWLYSPKAWINPDLI